MDELALDRFETHEEAKAIVRHAVESFCLRDTVRYLVEINREQMTRRREHSNGSELDCLTLAHMEESQSILQQTVDALDKLYERTHII